MENITKKILEGMRNKKIIELMYVHVILLLIDGGHLIKIACNWTVRSADDLIFLNGNSNQIEKLEKVNKMLADKILNKIELGNNNRHLKLHLDDSTIIYIQANPLMYENWEIATLDGVLGHGFDSELKFRGHC